MSVDESFYRFPDGFLWGSGVGDYQAFGGTECDLPFRWGARHFDRYPEDFDLMSNKLHHNAFRTAIEWARIEPKEGMINKDAISFYHRYFDILRKTGVKTFVSLHDFSNPMWVQEQGGWLSKRIVNKFSRYIELVCREFGSYIDYCFILNDPAVISLMSYYAGSSPDRGYRHTTTISRKPLPALGTSPLPFLRAVRYFTGTLRQRWGSATTTGPLFLLTLRTEDI